jgi:hypothetical protein
MNRRSLRKVFAGVGLTVVAGAAVVACTSDTGVVTTTYAYDDPYLYTAYYPADVAYASYYWAYPWDYSTFYYFIGAYTPPTPTATPAGGTTGTSTGGTTGTGTATVRSGLTAAIEALARGEQVCPGQVTVNEKTSASICASNAAAMRAGATITFNNCSTTGGTINGTIDITGTATASDQTCGAATTINLSHTSTITNLSIKVADGRTLVFPNGTNTGMTTFTYGQSPTTTNITTNGELQILDSSGSMQADLTFMGDNTFTFSGNQSYTIDGATTVHEKNGSASATISRQGLVRSGGCCRPTAGSITVDRTGGTVPGQASWEFGPSCGQVQRNNTTAQMPSCM